MDIVKRLRNYTIILALISIGLIVWMAVLDYNNLKLLYPDEELINTIIASLLAVTIAVGIYYRQLKDKLISNLNSLVSILNTLIDDFKNITLEREKLHESYLRAKQERTIDISKSIIINAVNSGYFKDESKELIEVLHVINNFYGSIFSLNNQDISEDEHLTIHHINSDFLYDLLDKFLELKKSI